MTEKQTNSPVSPRMSPYVFTLLLLGFGLWCFWDGWLNTDPDMADHILFNRALSIILLVWAIWDFFKIRKQTKLRKQSKNK